MPKDSATETYVALQVNIDNWRWAGVPFFIRTAKRMPKGGSEIAVTFKAVPRILFNQNEETLEQNVLVDPHPARMRESPAHECQASRLKSSH